MQLQKCGIYLLKNDLFLRLKNLVRQIAMNISRIRLDIYSSRTHFYNSCYFLCQKNITIWIHPDLPFKNQFRRVVDSPLMAVNALLNKKTKQFLISTIPLTTIRLVHLISRAIRLMASLSLFVSSSLPEAALRLEAPKLLKSRAKKRLSTWNGQTSEIEIEFTLQTRTKIQTEKEAWLIRLSSGSCKIWPMFG